MLHQLPVGKVYDPNAAATMLVHADEPLDVVLRRCAREWWPQTVCVIDTAGRVRGVLARRELIEWLRIRLGTALQGPSCTPERLLRLAQLARAETAGDALGPQPERIAVSTGDTCEIALQLLLGVDLVALPVIDEERRIVGDLTFAHVARHLVPPEDSPASVRDSPEPRGGERARREPDEAHPAILRSPTAASAIGRGAG